MMGWMYRTMEKAKQQKGFSLIELMVVVAIIGILFVVLVPKLNSSKDKAKAAGAKTDIRSIEVGLYNYIDDGNADFDGVTLADLKSDGFVDQSIGTDPWNGSYSIAESTNDAYVVVYSSNRGAASGITGVSDAGVPSGTVANEVYSVLNVNASGNVTKVAP